LSIGAAIFRTATPVSRYTLTVEITYDLRKSERNLHQRGFGFEIAAKFELDSANFRTDSRKDYGEIRTRAIGFIGNELFALVFTMRGRASSHQPKKG
jgi:uncharacterized DUF497 family protein